MRQSIFPKLSALSFFLIIIYSLKMTDLGARLADPPTDGITALRFCGDSNALLASSWDGVRDLMYFAYYVPPVWVAQSSAPATYLRFYFVITDRSFCRM